MSYRTWQPSESVAARTIAQPVWPKLYKKETQKLHSEINVPLAPVGKFNLDPPCRNRCQSRKQAVRRLNFDRQKYRFSFFSGGIRFQRITCIPQPFEYQIGIHRIPARNLRQRHTCSFDLKTNQTLLFVKPLPLSVLQHHRAPLSVHYQWGTLTLLQKGC